MLLLAQFIALSWIGLIIVDTYINLCIRSGVKIRKPLGCEKCMGFWIGLLFFYLNQYENFIIFALLTSFTSVMINKLRRL